MQFVQLLEKKDGITSVGTTCLLSYDEINKSAKILNSGNKNTITYTFYSYNNSEFNYVIKINNSKTGMLLGSHSSKEETQEIFDKLTFSLEK